MYTNKLLTIRYLCGYPHKYQLVLKLKIIISIEK